MSDNFDMAQMKARFQAAHEEFSDLVGKLNSGELEENELPRIYELDREIDGIMYQISAENQRIREKIEESRIRAQRTEMKIERLKSRAESLEKRLKKVSRTVSKIELGLSDSRIEKMNGTVEW